ncbi:ran-binding protein 3 [Dendroctonus ponderosae]|nr:ran-binding protein 3 [Dendroctonus ponderosae]KAH1017876.1 hypothetical protein HUJ05_008469 [Dendroctonus ponderosae]
MRCLEMAGKEEDDSKSKINMGDMKSNEPSHITASVNLSMEGPNDDSSSKQENDACTNGIGKVDDFKVCSPSKMCKMESKNSLISEHNHMGKSILKPSLLSLSSAASSGSVIRQSSFNPFSQPTKKPEISETKQMNGESLKFVPLLKSNSQISTRVEPASSQSNHSPKPSSPAFVFGQNIQERVVADATSLEPVASTSATDSNGITSTTSDMLFSTAMKSEAKPDTSKEKDTKSLTESAREYEESRATKRKYDEVEVKTGEEEETNIISISCKLFSFDKASSNWQERGRGTLRLNDFEISDDQMGSRLVFRTSGSLRVILNTKIWAGMTVDKASEKSIRLTALDSSGDIRVFLIMSTIEDSRHLYSHLQMRLQKEIFLQKRKKLQSTDNCSEQQ